MVQADFQQRPAQDVPPCPSCRRPVPIGEETASAYRFTIRKSGKQLECLKRDCYCGQELAIEKTGEYWHYSFRCRGCKQYVADLFPRRYCTGCELERVVGVKDATALVSGLAENDVFITPTRNDTLDGLIRGLLKGAPGLTIDDIAA